MKGKRILRALTILLGLVIVGLIVYRLIVIRRHAPHRAANAMIQPDGFGEVEPFKLTDQQGRPYGRADLAGSYWVADFIFTRCAGPCPILTSKMARLAKDYPQKNLKFVSFSVDPDYDTPEKLAAYAETYGADPSRWAFLTGDKKKMYALIRENFHLAVQEQMHMGHGNEMDVLHSLHFVLVGPDGKILGYHNSNDPESLAELRKRLDGLPSPAQP